MVIGKCKACGKEYQLSSSDNPDDFQCECGGELGYIGNLESQNEDSIKIIRIHWNTLIVGIVVTTLLSFVLGLIGIIIATTCVGYSVDRDFKNGAIHGALAGFVGGNIIIIMGNVLKIITLSSYINSGYFPLITETLISILICAFTGAIFGAIGALIKQKRD